MAELALLEAILKNGGYNKESRGGCSSAFLRSQFQKNIRQVQSDITNINAETPELTYYDGLIARWVRLTAAYMTLATWGHRETMTRVINGDADSIIDPDNYALGGLRYFDEHGDVDGDGCWNLEEWNRASTDVAALTSPANTGSLGVLANTEALTAAASAAYTPSASLTSLENIAQMTAAVYATYAMDPATGCAAAGDTLSGDALAEALGQNSGYDMRSVAFNAAGGLDFDAFVVSPGGYENSPLPKNTALSIANGREIRVVLNESDESKRWFATWSADGTLIDGSPKHSVTFTVSAGSSAAKDASSGLSVMATKVGTSFITVMKADGAATPVVTGEGPLADEIEVLGLTDRLVVEIPKNTYLHVETEALSSSDPNYTSFIEGYALTDGTMDNAGYDTTAPVPGPSLTMRCDSSWIKVTPVVNKRWTNIASDCLSEGSQGSSAYQDCVEDRDNHNWWMDHPLSNWWQAFSADGGGTVFGSPDPAGGFIPGGCMDRGEIQPVYPRVYDITYYSTVASPGFQTDKCTWPAGLVEPFCFGTAGSLDYGSDTGPIDARFCFIPKKTLITKVKVMDADGIEDSEAGSIASDDFQAYYTAAHLNDTEACYTTPKNVALTAVPNTGFRFVRWKGTGPLFDSESHVLTGHGSLDAGDDAKANWVTDSTIYVEMVDKGGDPADREVTAVFTYEGTLTVYIDDPGGGLCTCAAVGHTWVMISGERLDGATENTQKMLFSTYRNQPMGFYPVENCCMGQIVVVSCAGRFVIPDEQHSPTEGDTYTYQITWNQCVEGIRYMLNNSAARYHLYFNNCTGMARGIARAAGVKLPENFGIFPGFVAGDCPHALAEGYHGMDCSQVVDREPEK